MLGTRVRACVIITECVDDERNKSCAPGGSGEWPPGQCSNQNGLAGQVVYVRAN
jgi:hypothetical protein